MSTLLLLLGHGGEVGGWRLPPLHPLLVNFTAALIPTSVLSDWIGRFSRRESLHAAAWWMMLYAAVITPFTAAAGWWWRFQEHHPVDSAMFWHQWLGTSMAVVAVILGFWRWRLRDGAQAPGPAYLIAATLAVAALVVQADLGARMSFGAAAGGAGHSHADAGSTDGRTGGRQQSGVRGESGEAQNPDKDDLSEQDKDGGRRTATQHTHEHH